MNHRDMIVGINSYLANAFPDWQWDQRQAIAYCLMHASLNILDCDECDFHSLPFPEIEFYD